MAPNDAPEMLPENGETETSASSSELREWLHDLPRRGSDLIEALQQGRVKVTTAAAFRELAALAKSAKSNEKLAQKTREYAEQYARDRAALAEKNAELTEQVVACRNAVFYLLKSFEGVAAQADKIVETTALLGIKDDGKAPGAAALMLNFTMHGSKIMGNASAIFGGFDGTWLRRIDVEALKKLMEGTELDLHGYDRLTDLMHTLYPQPTIQIPATNG